MDNSGAEDLIPVDIWTTPIEIEDVEQEVKAQIGYNKADITAPYDREDFDVEIVGEYSAEQVDAYIAAERTIYVERQLNATEQFLNSCANIVNLQASRNTENIFVSKFAPLIRVELTKQEIETISNNEFVEVLYYSPPVEMIAETLTSIPTIQANYTRDTMGLDGSGVKIGMIEPSEPDRTKPYFTAGNFFFDTSKSRAHHPHSDMVAAIMVAKSYGGFKGIVPNAKLYSAYNSTDTQWNDRIEWLLLQNVNVINMSAYLGDGTTASYESPERWTDHIAINHSVHFVKSSGNNGGNVTSPGMAYNIITVGAINDNNTPSQTDDGFTTYSSYIQGSLLTNKPDLVAPGGNETPEINIQSAAGSDLGTSYSAPHVTGIVAQLCQKTPALKTMQDTVKSIITAGINHNHISYYTSSTGQNFDKMGAGCVDAKGAYYVTNSARYVSANFAANTTAGTTRNYTFNTTSADTVIRVSLSWLKYSTLSGTHSSATPTVGTLADLDLHVYDKNNDPVGTGNSVYNNTEIVQFTPSASLSPYRIEVKQYANSDRTVYYTVSWY
ncbi:hypothetical protein FACS1894132_12520 [Clostridia bacterium]|nr:hypothetical protein FACS1894132_12520 [Clostridia bacterium]